MQMASMLLPMAGGLLSAGGNLQVGRAQAQEANFEASQLDQNAGQTEAAGQRASAEAIRDSEMAQSHALAVAGASGAGAMDPGVLRIISGLAGEGARAAQTEEYNARSNAEKMRTQAKATRYQGSQTVKASKIQAAATILGGVGQGVGNWYGAGRYFNQPTNMSGAEA